MIYIQIGVVAAIIAVLLFKKCTRKIMLKLLLGLALTVSVLAVIGFIEFHLFDFELTFLVIYPFTVTELILLAALIFAFKYLAETLQLNRYGCRTTGKIIEISGGRGGHYKIQYYVDGQEYICKGNRLTYEAKGKCGDDAEVIYLKDNPQKSCMEKVDLISSVIIAVFAAFLMTGTIAAEYIILSGV